MGRETVGIMAITAEAAPEWSMITGRRRQEPTITAALRRPRAMPGSPRIIRSGLIPALTLMCRTRPLPSLPPDTGGIPMTIIGTTGMTGTTRMTGGITTEDPEYSTARAGDTVPEAGGSSSMAAAGCQGGGSSYITDGTALTKMDIC